MLCCGYTLTDFPTSVRLTSLALWQSNDCPSASKATLMNMDKYFMWIHYERLHNHNKAKHNETVCLFLGIYCIQCKTKCVHVLWYILFFSRIIRTDISYCALFWSVISRIYPNPFVLEIPIGKLNEEHQLNYMIKTPRNTLCRYVLVIMLRWENNGCNFSLYGNCFFLIDF